LGELLMKAGLPNGACNILPCDSKNAGPLVDDPRVKAVTFTGSGAVGWGIKQRAYNKKVTLELGGNAVAIVEPSTDLEPAVRRIVVGGYAHTGQICISVQHVSINADRYDEFAAAYIKQVEALRMGDPLEETTEVAAMIDEGEAIRIGEWIDEAVRAGGKLLCGGSRTGNRITPAVLSDVPDNCRISREEAFAPVTLIRKHRTFDEALEWVNGQQYGLQAGVFTRNIHQAMVAFNRLETGGVIIEDIPTFRSDNYPYGGVKNSGFGREGVKYAMEEMSELRTLVLPSPR
jgi:acyl-CoA reductase-like NAD-dependent aldehyde dehydrogenase